jgi:ribonuclease HII
MRHAHLTGVDEAGRGPLAGPVVAAAVILDPGQPIAGLADSKTLSPERREQLAGLIRARAFAIGIGWADPEEIDRINILQATLQAMRRAVESLGTAPGRSAMGGGRLPSTCTQPGVLRVATLVRGDTKVAAISAASIIAKTWRDQLMNQLDTRFPGYGFAIHKGYPTAAHLLALDSLGVSPVHRRSYAPVKLRA